MHILRLAILLILFFDSIQAQVFFEFKKNSSHVYQYTWGDEFDGTSYNQEKWMSGYPWARHLYCSLDANYYSDGADLLLKDGLINITARREKVKARAIPYESNDFMVPCDKKPSIKNLMDFDYQSGLLYSKEKFTYGHFEIRFKTAVDAGLWPAFWLFGADNQEIDIFEMGGGRKSDFHVDVHCKSGCKNYPVFAGLFRKNWGDYISSNADWSKDFHIIGITWEKEGITWYLDQKPVAWWKGSFHDPLALIANLAVTDKAGSIGGKISSDAIFPASFTIDYIRVWQEVEMGSSRTTVVATKKLESPEIKTPALLKKKSRPEYKRSKLKNASERVFVSMPDTRTLQINREGPLSDNIQIQVKNSEGNKLILEKQIRFKSENISLNNLPPGKYLVIIKNNQLEQSILIEVR